MKLSANLGFLWTDRPLPEAIRAAGAAGFDAVECHWPYDVPPGDIVTALRDTGLRMLGLNTRRGDVAAGERGLAALPGREAEARASIDEAIAYAAATGTAAVHVMAGVAQGPEAEATFRESLRHACREATPHGITILIEPLNGRDVPGYFLATATQAAALIRDLDLPALKMMFDCYHVQIMEGDLTHRLAEFLPLIGHIQIAAVPDRGTPDHGEVDYRHIAAEIDRLGWTAAVGAEYHDPRPTEETLGWMGALRGTGAS